MIKVENVKIRGKEFYYTYSDEGYFIANATGNRFASAYDLKKVEYTETSEKIEKEKEKEESAND